MSHALAATDQPFSFVVSQPLGFGEATVSDVDERPAVVTFDEIPADEDAVSKPTDAAGVVDRTHKIVSQRFIRFFRQIDDYFGSDIPTQHSNESWAKVRIDTIKSAGEEPTMKGALKLRVVLPKAEKRFRLLFSTEDEQLDGPAQNGQTNTNDNNGYSLALRFIRQARKNGMVSLDLGARYREKKAQIFGRIELNYTRDLKWNLRSRLNNSLYHYSASGYENKFRYELSWLANEQETVTLRAATELLWAKNRRGTLIGETIGIYSDLGDRKALAIEGLASYTTALNIGDINNFRGAEFRFRFRHNVWRRWFYYELWPAVSWASVNSYEPSFGGMVRIETIFGKY